MVARPPSLARPMRSHEDGDESSSISRGMCQPTTRWRGGRGKVRRRGGETTHQRDDVLIGGEKLAVVGTGAVGMGDSRWHGTRAGERPGRGCGPRVVWLQGQPREKEYMPGPKGIVPALIYSRTFQTILN
jgi:hypothetical protein